MEEPCEYIRACEDAIDIFNESVSWLELKEHFKKQKEEHDEEMDEDSYDDEDEDQDEDVGED